MRELLNFMTLLKDGYWKTITPVCEKYGLTVAEFDIVMVLSQAAELDTATEIVKVLNIAKSQVSMSIKALEKKNYLLRTYVGDNRRTIHLKLCEAAKQLVNEGKEAQDSFLKVALQGFDKAEIERIGNSIRRMSSNIREYVKG